MMVDKRALQLTAGFEFGTRVKTLFMSHSGLSQAMSYTRPSEAIHQKTGIFLANLHLIKIQAARWSESDLTLMETENNLHQLTSLIYLFFSVNLDKKISNILLFMRTIPIPFPKLSFFKFSQNFSRPRNCNWKFPWFFQVFMTVWTLKGITIHPEGDMDLWTRFHDNLTKGFWPTYWRKHQSENTHDTKPHIIWTLHIYTTNRSLDISNHCRQS